MEEKLSKYGIPEEYDRMFDAFLKESDEEGSGEIRYRDAAGQMVAVQLSK